MIVLFFDRSLDRIVLSLESGTAQFSTYILLILLCIQIGEMWKRDILNFLQMYQWSFLVPLIGGR